MQNPNFIRTELLLPETVQQSSRCSGTLCMLLCLIFAMGLAALLHAWPSTLGAQHWEIQEPASTMSLASTARSWSALVRPFGHCNWRGTKKTARIDLTARSEDRESQRLEAERRRREQLEKELEAANAKIEWLLSEEARSLMAEDYIKNEVASGPLDNAIVHSRPELGVRTEPARPQLEKGLVPARGDGIVPFQRKFGEEFVPPRNEIAEYNKARGGLSAMTKEDRLRIVKESGGPLAARLQLERSKPRKSESIAPQKQLSRAEVDQMIRNAPTDEQGIYLRHAERLNEKLKRMEPILSVSRQEENKRRALEVLEALESHSQETSTIDVQDADAAMLASADAKLAPEPLTSALQGSAGRSQRTGKGRLKNSGIDIPDLQLRGGDRMPALGLGTSRMEPGETTENAVRWGLKMGYRMVDTAAIYGNEESIAKAIKGSCVPREDIFLTTTLRDEDHGYYEAKTACIRSLGRLGTLYVDLYLIHSPTNGKLVETWDALLELQRTGAVKHIGVANFNISHLEALESHGRPLPVVNQIEMHPLVLRERQALVDWCKAKGILVQAYGSMLSGRREFLDDRVLLGVAAVKGKSATQVLLRWGFQMGFQVIPKSIRKRFIRENMDIFDFELNSDEMEQLSLMEGRLKEYSNLLGADVDIGVVENWAFDRGQTEGIR